MKLAIKGAILVFTCVALAASAAELPAPAEPASGPAMSSIAERRPADARPRSRGSLYSEGDFQSFTSDRRQFRAGDVITIQVVESASATSSADTGTQRDAQVGLTASKPGRDRQFSAGTNNEFNGTGRTQRSGRLLAQIAVSVREVMPNGDLQVSGEQLLEINGERQTIRVEGRARPRDVNEQNTLLSNRLADAKLSFSGNGVLADMQQPKWWQRLLSVFGI